jgi:hypothetical protein
MWIKIASPCREWKAGPPRHWQGNIRWCGFCCGTSSPRRCSGASAELELDNTEDAFAVFFM